MTEWSIVVSVVMKICCIILRGNGMNIIEAAKELKIGKKIRCKDWNIKLFMIADSIWIYGTTDRYFLCLDDILAEDWEVIE